MDLIDPNDTPEDKLKKLMFGQQYQTPMQPQYQSSMDSMDPLMPEGQKESTTLPTSQQQKTTLADTQVDSEQQFGMPNQYRSAGQLLASQADIHNNRAMDLLKESLKTQAEVSPSQALAAGILALVPTLGGYMAGKMVGSPKLSPHLRMSVDDLATYGTGGAQGAMAALPIGTKAANDYLGSFQTNLDKQNKTRTEMAALESKQASPYESAQAANIENAAQNISADQRQEQSFQNQLLANAAQQSTSFENQKKLEELRRQREDLTPEQAAIVREKLGLSPDAPINIDQAKNISNVFDSARRSEQFERSNKQLELPMGWKWDAVPDPKTADLAKTKLAAFEDYLGAAEQLKQAVKVAGRFAIQPDGSQKSNAALANLRAAAGRFYEAQKTKSGAGAALTPLEAEVYFGPTPAFFGSPLKGIGSALMEAGLRLDAGQQMDAIIQSVIKQREDQLRGLGASRLDTAGGDIMSRIQKLRGGSNVSPTN